MSVTPPALTPVDDRAEVLELSGTLTFAEAGPSWDRWSATLEQVQRGQRFDFDMSRVDEIDGGSMALLVALRAELHRRGVRSEFIGAPEQVQRIIQLYSGDVKVGPLPKRRAPGLLDQLGNSTLHLLRGFREVFGFFGDAMVAFVTVVRRPRSANWKDLWPTMEKTGADAVPIVTLINYLIGLVMGFQGAVQLKQFGANIYVADLVGLSITRELGPLMTAIIVSGRSGAAFAAEIGTMKVSEEIDALRTMGFGPMRFLVLPRTLALVLVLPVLTLLGDLVGIIGGMTVGLLSLDLTVTGYVNETLKAIELWDIASGVIKSVLFALVIALVACQQGLATTGGAEGVGRRTTSSVVSILFGLILVDACFTVFFHWMAS
ncbi:MAG: MlaE family lipid ABC transporter permease subunit [Myxococcales bacterium]|nr:MlaE family lipid ABC transporter permease subunit [Myxococcales bacterium]